MNFIGENGGVLLYGIFFRNDPYPLLFNKAYLFCIKPWNKWMYLLNLIHQLYQAVVTQLLYLYLVYLFFTVIIFTIVYLEAIELLIQDMREDQNHNFTEWLRTISRELYFLKS